MEDILENLNAALADAWARYRVLSEEPDAELDAGVVRELAAVVDKRLSEFQQLLLADAAKVRSVLVNRFEEVMFGRDLRVRAAQLFAIPKGGDELEVARAQGPEVDWRLHPRKRRAPPVRRGARRAVLALAPPGSELEVEDKNQSVSLTACTTRIPLRLSHRVHVIPFLLPAPRGWDELFQVPEISAARADQRPLPLPAVFGSERGQWRYPDAPVRLRWWTELGGGAEGVGALGPDDGAAPEEAEHARLLWIGRRQGVGHFRANLLEVEIDVLALRRLPRLEGAHHLELDLRFPSQLGAAGIFMDHARVGLGSSPEALDEAYRPLFSPRFADYAKPHLWHLETEGAELELQDVLVTVPAHRPADAGGLPPRSRLEHPERRRNLLRAALRGRATIVTAEDLADAADELLAEVGHVKRSGIRGVPTWLEADLRLLEKDPRLEEFAGFVWVVPFVRHDSAARAERQLEAAASIINRRVPIGCRVVFEALEV